MFDAEVDDYYKILGVSHDASAQDICQAWKKSIIERNKAYDVLMDEKNRALYDKFLKEKVSKSTPRVFGIRKKDGLPCQRCINYGKYCYQHTDQDPFYKTPDEKSSQSNTKAKSSTDRGSASTKPPLVFGIRKKDGLPCQRCINYGKYCFQHKDQA